MPDLPMRPTRLALVPLVIAAFSLQDPDSRDANAQASPEVPPLPAGDRLVEGTGLSATLRIIEPRVPFGDAPRFTLVLRNTGTSAVLVRPLPATDLRIFDASGTLVLAPDGFVDRSPSRMSVNDMIAIAPGQAREFRVEAEYHSSDDYSHVSSYSSPYFQGLVNPWALRPGRYTARLTFFSFPDYGIDGYVGDDFPRSVWEGRLEGAPVNFTVVAPAAAARPDPRLLFDERGVVHFTPRGAETPAARALRSLAGLRVPPSTYALLSRYQHTLLMNDLLMVAPDPTLRESVVRRLVDALATLPPLDRDEMVDTVWFAAVLSEAPGCSGASLMLRSLHAPAPDIVQRLSDPARLIARRCPALRGRLRAMVEAPPGIRPSPRHLTQRRVAVRLLGAIGDPEDVPLLIRQFESGTPNTRATCTDSRILRIAALQALAETGGPSTARILTAHMEETLTDPTLTPRVIDAVMRLSREERARELSRLLSSSSPRVLASAIDTLRQLGVRASLPQLRTLTSHVAPQVMFAAARAVQELGGFDLDATLAAARNPDKMVRAEAIGALAHNADASILPLFIKHVTSSDTMVRTAAAVGIERFGTAATYRPLRIALEDAAPAVAATIDDTLGRLTFVAPPAGADRESTRGAFWDAWWNAHARLTRLQWAELAMTHGATVPTGHEPPGGHAVQALYYIATRRPSVQVAQLATAKNASIRLAAAEIVARRDASFGAQLLLREIDNRYLRVCRMAAETLGVLTGRSGDLDCRNPASRRSAKRVWADGLRDTPSISVRP